MISASVPYLTLQHAIDGRPISATFIAYFKLADDPKQTWDGQSYEAVCDPGDFRPARQGEHGPFQMVRVRFDGGIVGRVICAFGDNQVVEEDAYDWSDNVSEMLPGESLEENIERGNRYWLETGLSPSPRMYEVLGSPWIAEVANDRKDLHHYILLGHDEYVAVIAKSWDWDLGQVVA